MRRFLFRDPMTRKKSLTVTCLVWSFLLYLCAVILYLAGYGDLKITLIALFAVGVFYAGYRQKRVRISFTGVEIESDKGACNAAD